MYDLAIVATLEKQPETAKQYFTQAAGLSADPHIKAWSHIYLGRLLDLQGNRDEAKAEYSAALAVGDPGPTLARRRKKVCSRDSPPAQRLTAQAAPRSQRKSRASEFR